ncbi:MAG: tetratricopeptide repeat protein [Pseudomonas sp.]|uniref:tetratricopeptide repeat protein n=1 Tax=Pseudomonas sp. TaxID=306 RepID=UPI003D0D87BA
MKALGIVVASLWLVGCAGQSAAPDWFSRSQSAMSCQAEASQEQDLALSLAQEMASDGRLHAALAHLQKLSSDSPQVRLRKARVLRSLGRDEAQAEYQSLIGTCLAAEGEHGLGQLALARGAEAEALERLERAARMEPTDARMRNDLGVVYLRQGRPEDARFEFLTALELDQSSSLSALNLLTLLFYNDQWDQAAELVSRQGFSPDQVRGAEARARSLRDVAAAKLPAADVAASTQEQGS